MRILVVDDSVLERRFLVRLLTRLGHSCVEAEDGPQALEMLPELGTLNAIMIDWNMPGMNGGQLVSHIRANPVYQNVPLIMVTSEADLDRVAEALGAGADEYIMKPFTPAIIDEKLQVLGFFNA